MREIVLDTETTGLEAKLGERIIEIGCLELLNHCPTGRTFHVYLNPDRPVSAGALAVHGITDEFLADKPRFGEIVTGFLEFIGDDPLIIHNAAFDLGFLDAELARCGLPAISPDRTTDTLLLARRKHPGASNSLDALCQRYGIDNSRRTHHGALLDAEILAEVYVELLGGRQTGFNLMTESAVRHAQASHRAPLRRQSPRVSPLSEIDLARHAAFVATLAQPVIWQHYTRRDPDNS